MKKSNRILSRSLSAATLACLSFGALSFGAPPILGGVNVKPQEPVAEFTVMLLDLDKGALCTGSLISPNAVLTAAHCIENPNAKLIVAFSTGELDPKKDPIKIVTEAVAHPDYGVKASKVVDPKSPFNGVILDNNDIAVVKFTGKLPSNYHTVDLIAANRALVQDEKLLLVGYGITKPQAEDPNGATAGTLRQALVPVLIPQFGRSEIMMDQTQGTGACHGDSGGGAFTQDNGGFQLVGVTSRGFPADGTDDCKHQGIYTSARAHIDFIKKHVPSVQ